MGQFRPSYFNLSLLLITSTAVGQGAHGTVRGESLKVYQQMSLGSNVATTLQQGATVQIDMSITGEGGTWCGISQIEPRARLGSATNCSARLRHQSQTRPPRRRSLRRLHKQRLFPALR